MAGKSESVPGPYKKPTKEQKDQNEYYTLHASMVYSLLPFIRASDRELVNRWMNKLNVLRENEEERKIRNDYIWFLLVQLESGIVTIPFIKDPPKQIVKLSEAVDKRIYMKIMEAANNRLIDYTAELEPKIDDGKKVDRVNRCRPSEFYEIQPKPKCGFIAYGSCFSNQLY